MVNAQNSWDVEGEATHRRYIEPEEAPAYHRYGGDHVDVPDSHDEQQMRRKE